MLVIECKNASKDEAIALGVDQIRRYHAETPEVMVPEMLFTATEAIGFAYGVTWNTVRRNIFNWKHEEVGNLEAKVKSFCAIRMCCASSRTSSSSPRRTRSCRSSSCASTRRRRWTRSCARALDPEADARLGLAHAGQRQDLHDDQGGRAAVQGARGARSRRSC